MSAVSASLLAAVALVFLCTLLFRSLAGRKAQPEDSRPRADAKTSEFCYCKVPITPQPDLDVATTKAHPYRPWKAGRFAMTMGIIRTPQEEWLAVDDQYEKEQELRRCLLREHREGVMQVLPGSEAACAEALDFVVSFLTRRYPHLFYALPGKTDYVHNALTQQTFRVTAPFEQHPLEVAAQLAMEDLSLLIQGFGPDPEQHYLAASYSMAPAGWHLEERIGWPLWKIHTPVPMWEDKLRKTIEKAFLRMKPEELISRHNFFMQPNDVLFQQEPFAAEEVDAVTIDSVRLRHERQTLRRLPRTRAIMFTVRTYLLPVVDLQSEPESIRELLGAIRAMPPAMAEYKGKAIWGGVVEEWCEKELEKAGIALA